MLSLAVALKVLLFGLSLFSRWTWLSTFTLLEIFFVTIAIVAFQFQSVTGAMQGRTHKEKKQRDSDYAIASLHVWLSAWCVAWCFALGCFLCLVLGGLSGDGFFFRDLFFFVWIALWGTDCALAVLESRGQPSANWTRNVRGTLVLLVFFSCLLASLPAGAGWVWFAGMCMVTILFIAFLLRLVLLPFDHESATGKVFLLGFRQLNHWWAWHELPTSVAVLNLAALREELRVHNLHDTSFIPATHAVNAEPSHSSPPTDWEIHRMHDGRFNDTEVADMGRDGQGPTSPCSRFGRNVPLEMVRCDESRLLSPSPREVSRILLARNNEMKPATGVNLLVAAWIQFEVHDWFSHGEPIATNPIEIPLTASDSWSAPSTSRAGMGCPMHVRRTKPDPTRDYAQEQAHNVNYPETFASTETHWWDASQVYGNPIGSPQLRQVVDGKRTSRLTIDKEMGLAIDPLSSGDAVTGFRENWWVGLTLMHTLFSKEHNAICDAIERSYPEWDPDTVYHKARLINAALIAKIHTVEWTPAILQNPALEIAMPANWWGLFSKRITDTVGRWGLNEAFWGIPQSGVDHHTAPYALTEEFAAVYRLHPMMPDELIVRNIADGSIKQTYRFPDGVVGNQSALRDQSLRHSQAELLFSFGLAHPGRVELFNYPEFLRTLQRADGERIDLATIDVLRDRERGVPRYNAMRRSLRLPPIDSFDCFDYANRKDPSQNKLSVKIREVYGSDKSGRDSVEDLDLMVGMFAEEKPPGFAISDTAFRIFILMASRRIKSDRFLAADFRPEIYTQLGLDWVNQTTMSDILVRHYPELQPGLYGIDNAFKPWKR